MPLPKRKLRMLNRRFRADARALREIFAATPTLPSRQAAEALQELEAHMRQGEAMMQRLNAGASKRARRKNRAEIARLRLLIKVVDRLGAAVAATDPQQAAAAVTAAESARRRYAAARRRL